MARGAAIWFVGFALAAPASAAAATAGPVPGSVVISNERTVTWSGTPAALAHARQRPDVRSPPITRLRWYTEDGYP